MPASPTTLKDTPAPTPLAQKTTPQLERLSLIRARMPSNPATLIAMGVLDMKDLGE